MDVVEKRKELLSGTIAALFQDWEQQLRQKSEEYDALAKRTNELQGTLNVKDELITRLSNENVSLREEVDRLQFRSGEDDSPRLKALIEKHNSLYKEYELQKATAAARELKLTKRLRYEREKVKSWARFSSPGPRPAHLILATPSGANHVQAQNVDRDEARIALTGGRPAANGSLQQNDGLSRENWAASPRVEHRSNRNIEGGSNYLQDSTNTLQRNTPTSAGSRLTEQPGKSPEPGSSFVDAHLPLEPTASSPDLPSIAVEGRSPITSNEEQPTDAKKAANPDSLPQIRGSDSTAPPSEPPVISEVGETVANEDSASDTPEFLGARSVKKNTSRVNATITHLPTGNMAEPVIIKSDPDTGFVSSKPPQLIRFGSSIHESLDPTGSEREQRSPRKQRPETTISSSASKIAVQDKRAELPSFESNQSIIEARISQAQMALQSLLPNNQRRVRSDAEHTPALREIDGNIRKLLRDVEALNSNKSKKRKSDESRGVAAIPIISDDVENYARKAPRISKDRTSSPHLANPSVHQRLNSLLTGPPGPKEVLPRISKKTIQEMDEYLASASLCLTYSGKKPFNALLQSDEKDWEWWDDADRLLSSGNHRTPRMPLSHPSKQRESRTTRILPTSSSTSTPKPTPPPFSRSPAIARSPAITTARPTHGQPKPKSTPRSSRSPAPEPSHTPYRSLPLSSLNLSHFKLNPTANQNLTYAFTSVVRDQSARKCLPGCIRPECCGPKFEALARTLPQNALQKQPQRQQPQEEENKGEKEEGDGVDDSLLPQAQALSTKYGRTTHRHLHARPPTPPGFWNVDFASTQEQQKEREEAERRERAEVERRWRVAMGNPDPRKTGREEEGRGGGLWMFADE